MYGSDWGQARGRSRLIDVRPNALFEGARDEINFANQASAVLIVDQRGALAGSVKIDSRAGKPFPDDRGEFRGADAAAAAIVGKMRELGLERQADELPLVSRSERIERRQRVVNP